MSNPVAEVWRYLSQLAIARRELLGQQRLELNDLPGRVLSQGIPAPVDLPAFPRAMMDGVAVVSGWLADDEGGKSNRESSWQPGTDLTSGAAQGCHLSVIRQRESALAQVAAGGRCGYPVATGNLVPPPFDTVVPVEQLRGPTGQALRRGELPDEVQVLQPETVLPRQHVARVGEDIARGQELLAAGRVIRPQDLGLLSACGLTSVHGYKIPQVHLGLTGEEIIPPGRSAAPEQIHDANGPVLRALLGRDGVLHPEITYLPDDPQAIRDFLEQGDQHVKLLCGGTSAGPHDYAATSLEEVGELAFHGLNIRPGRPLGVGATGSAIVFLLPGNPIACQFTYDLLVRPTLKILSRQSIDWPYTSEIVEVDSPVPSQAGRMDYLRVRRSTVGREVVQVTPLTSGRASNLSSVSRADGFILIPEDLADLPAGQRITCYWYD